MPGTSTRVRWRATLLEEDGRSRTFEGQSSTAGDQLEIPLPPQPLGYHRLRVELGTDGTEPLEQRRIVVPARSQPAQRRAGGIWTNLYTLRSRRNAGMGDLGDLRLLARAVAREGGSFVGLNPLHAIRGRGPECSPYSPVSRRFKHAAYIEVEAVPEYRASPAIRAWWNDDATARRRERLREAAPIDYEAVLDLKEEAFLRLHREFAAHHRHADTARGRAYRAFLDDQGDALADHATFLGLDRHFKENGVPWWREWPAEYRDPRAPAVERFRRDSFEEFDRYRYLEFELDRQLGRLARDARAHGLDVGLYQDLAIGSMADGSDVWADPGRFVLGMSLGAPPDGFARDGQVWALPPLNPRRMRADGYASFARVLAANMRHSGALRIDHVIGMVRQYWIPDGTDGTDGVFVPFPADDLFGVLALESRRNRTVVIGEDLGTIPPELPEMLRRHGVLSSRVLLFERDHRGEFGTLRDGARRALLTTTTHDHVPLPGWIEGAELELHRRLGRIETDDELEAARHARRRDVESLVRWLVLHEPDGAFSSPASIVEGVHRRMRESKCTFVGISLDDVAGETEPVNVPGVTAAQHPVWRRKMSATLESLLEKGSLGPLRRRPARRATASTAEGASDNRITS